MQIRQALNIQRGDTVAFIGAGGKTSAMFRLADELVGAGYRVVLTTTTRIAVDELSYAASTVQISAASLRPEAVIRALTEFGTTFVYSAIQGDKVIGLSVEMVEALSDLVDADMMLVEADGARNLPFKAPRPHEPVIPPSSSLVVPMVGYDVVGRPFSPDYVYNPQGMHDRYGYAWDDKIKGAWLASVIRDEELGLKGIPARARIVPLINKVPSHGMQRMRARVIARMMLREPRINAAAVGAIRGTLDPIHAVEKRLAAVVLAGGLSSRMGQSKMLLPWDGRPVIKVITDKLKRMRLEDIVVVTGHEADAVKEAVNDKAEQVRCVYNRAYKRGDMLSSLQAGLRALGDDIAGALIVLGDQPHVENRVILDVLTAYAEGRGTIIAPSYNQRRGHPILLDRVHWQEILELPTEAAPRDVINRHPEAIGYVEATNDSILRDIDTPEDYQSERRRAGLG